VPTFGAHGTTRQRDTSSVKFCPVNSENFSAVLPAVSPLLDDRVAGQCMLASVWYQSRHPEATRVGSQRRHVVARQDSPPRGPRRSGIERSPARSALPRNRRHAARVGPVHRHAVARWAGRDPICAVPIVLCSGRAGGNGKQQDGAGENVVSRVVHEISSCSGTAVRGLSPDSTRARAPRLPAASTAGPLTIRKMPVRRRAHLERVTTTTPCGSDDDGDDHGDHHESGGD
jgi:hypothetical protein